MFHSLLKMNSVISSDPSSTRTRSQEDTQKRSAEKKLKPDADIKRRKKKFEPRKVVGPHNILVNTKLPKIKLEEDVASSSSVKLEPLATDCDSMAAESSRNFLDSNVQFLNPEIDTNLLEVSNYRTI